MYSYHTETVEELKEKVLSLPLERLTSAERARCLKEEKLRNMTLAELEELHHDKIKVWVKFCDKIKKSTERRIIHVHKRSLLRSAYNVDLILKELNRRQKVQPNNHAQQLPQPTAPSVQVIPSLEEELDSFDLDAVSFEDLFRDVDNGSDVQHVAPFDDLDPIPLDFNIDELPDLNADELVCLFD